MRHTSKYHLTLAERNALMDALRAFIALCRSPHGCKPPKHRVTFAEGIHRQIERLHRVPERLIPACGIVASYEGCEIINPSGTLDNRWLKAKNGAIMKIAEAEQTGYDDCFGIYRLQYDSV